MTLAKLKEMFTEMVEKKDISLFPQYYHENFFLTTNGKEMDYQEFLDSHIKYYSTPIQYEVEYQDETLVESKDKVAGRVWITTTLPDESPKKLEVILIALYKEGKIFRLWELTWPDWSQLKAFQP